MDLRSAEAGLRFQSRQGACCEKKTLKSPCIKICVMDPQRGVCLGCCRTLDEIMRWSAMCDAERDRVMAELPQRRKALDIREIAVPPLA